MREADKQILADHYLDFYQMAYAMLQNEADAEDAVQDAIVATLTKHLWGDPCRYCTVALRNICARMRKKGPILLFDNLRDVPNPEPSADRRRLHQLLDLTDQLPPRVREVLYMHYAGGLSKAEIARQLGISVTVVKKLFKRGHYLLRKQMIEI